MEGHDLAACVYAKSRVPLRRSSRFGGEGSRPRGCAPEARVFGKEGLQAVVGWCVRGLPGAFLCDGILVVA